MTVEENYVSPKKRLRSSAGSERLPSFRSSALSHRSTVCNEVQGELMWEQFRHSALHQRAIAQALENIGEVANKVSDKMKAAHPEVPWVFIMPRRKRTVHEYFRLGSPQGMGSENSRCADLDH